MEIKQKNNGIKKDVYLEIGSLKRQSVSLRNIASTEDVNFDKSQEIRKQQENVYNKMNFYNGFVKAVSKQGGL